MSSDGGYCRIFWGKVPWMSWYFSGDLINQCDLSNICFALQLTWKLTNHMKISLSPCLQDMLCFVNRLPKNYSNHSWTLPPNITKIAVFDDFSLWKYRLPFLLSLMVLQSPSHFTNRFRDTSKSMCSLASLSISWHGSRVTLRCILCQLWIWKNMRNIWVKMDQNTFIFPKFPGWTLKIDWISTHPI